VGSTQQHHDHDSNPAVDPAGPKRQFPDPYPIGAEAMPEVPLKPKSPVAHQITRQTIVETADGSTPASSTRVSRDAAAEP